MRTHSTRATLLITLAMLALPKASAALRAPEQGFDPATYIERTSVPVLALYGELDPMSPPHVDVPLLSAGLDRAENPDVTIHVFPAANHVFRAARTGLRDEYASLDTAYVPGFLDTLGSWVLTRAGVASSGEGSEHARPAAPEPARTRRWVNQLSIHGGMTRLDYQDVVHTPFVHHAHTPLSLGIAYRRDARWVQFAHVRLDGARSRLRRYTIEMHGHENFAHEYFLTDASYGLGRRLGAGSSAAAGLAASLGLQAVSYGYGVEENFGYVMHPSLDAWLERERRLGDRQLVRGRLSAPLVSWLARSPYMVNDDRFIENIADGNPLSIAVNFLRDGKPAGWGARQAAEATIDHELAIFSRLSVGTSYRFALLRASEPRPLTSLRNSIAITSSLRY